MSDDIIQFEPWEKVLRDTVPIKLQAAYREAEYFQGWTRLRPDPSECRDYGVAGRIHTMVGLLSCHPDASALHPLHPEYPCQTFRRDCGIGPHVQLILLEND